MITKYKLFEIFDSSNIYEYQLVSKKQGIEDPGDHYILYLYRFTGKDNINYYVRLWFFDKKKNPKNEKNFISLDFMDEEQYKKDKKVKFNINFKNTQKQDAIKTINTVFNILVENQKENNPWVICFDCFPDRYKTYLYCVEKYLPGYIRLSYEETDKAYFFLYNSEFYVVSEDETKIIRKDNKKVIYDSEENDVSESIDIDPYSEEKWDDDEEEKWDDDEYDYIDIIDDNVPIGTEICDYTGKVIGKVYDYEHDHKSIYIEFYRNVGFNPIKKGRISTLNKAKARYKIKK